MEDISHDEIESFSSILAQEFASNQIEIPWNIVPKEVMNLLRARKMKLFVDRIVQVPSFFDAFSDYPPNRKIALAMAMYKHMVLSLN